MDTVQVTRSLDSVQTRVSVPTPARRSLRSKPRYRAGHDYEFVSAPPSNLECSICLLTLRNPMVVSCCGNHFCEECIGRIKEDKKPCPLCNDPDYSIMLHKGVRRDVNALAVLCPNNKRGCDWTGELGKVGSHLNAESRDSSGCPFVEIECANNCGSIVLRKDLLEHEKITCPKKTSRDLEHESAVKMASDDLAQVRREIQELHNEKRKLEADVSASKQQLEDLQASVKSLETTVVQLTARVRDCELGKAESTEQVRKLKDISSKVIRIERQQMLDTLKHEKMQADMASQKEALQANMQVLETQLTPLPPFHFTLHNVRHYQENNFHWQSEAFYAFPRGYKFKVSVYPNGISKGMGSYLSLYVSIVGGEYDNNLRWPFKGTICIHIYNCTLGNWTTVLPIEFEETDSVSFTGKPAGLNAANPGLGFSQWIGLVELHRDFTHRGVVKFKVDEVVLG